MDTEDIYADLSPTAVSNSLQSQAQKITLAELRVATDPHIRALLIHDFNDLAIFKLVERREKKKDSGKIRRKQTREERLKRRITQKATINRKKIIKPPEFNPAWSLDKEQKDKIVPPKEPVTTIQEIEKQNIENLLNFTKSKEGKLDATE